MSAPIWEDSWGFWDCGPRAAGGWSFLCPGLCLSEVYLIGPLSLSPRQAWDLQVGFQVNSQVPAQACMPVGKFWKDLARVPWGSGYLWVRGIHVSTP